MDNIRNEAGFFKKKMYMWARVCSKTAYELILFASVLLVISSAYGLIEYETNGTLFWSAPIAWVASAVCGVVGFAVYFWFWYYDEITDTHVRLAQAFFALQVVAFVCDIVLGMVNFLELEALDDQKLCDKLNENLDNFRDSDDSCKSKRNYFVNFTAAALGVSLFIWGFCFMCGFRFQQTTRRFKSASGGGSRNASRTELV